MNLSKINGTRELGENTMDFYHRDTMAKQNRLLVTPDTALIPSLSISLEHPSRVFNLAMEVGYAN